MKVKHRLAFILSSFNHGKKKISSLILLLWLFCNEERERDRDRSFFLTHRKPFPSLRSLSFCSYRRILYNRVIISVMFYIGCIIMLYMSVQQCALCGLDFMGSWRLWNHVDLQRVSTSGLWWTLVKITDLFSILYH